MDWNAWDWGRGVVKFAIALHMRLEECKETVKIPRPVV